MILDTLDNYQLYSTINERIAKGFAFLHNTDLDTISSGRHDIEGDTIFALVQEYQTKPLAECKLESHKKYIDIQYVIRGEEFMGVTTKNNQKILEQDEDKDYTFYEGTTSLVRVSKGMFTIFFPDDLHQPCVQTESAAEVKKVVIKVLIQ
ncbi:YhcH/YjgK/YiaL family protein [Flavobacterium sp.]|uniref:YhcH/YjgK/YiaL family protein n=1 Tax=Flavobacterium sp. TaxID=239 RepID=UPI0035B157EE